MTSNIGPPETDGSPIINKDLPKTSEPWADVHYLIDIVLVTVKDCEFLSCLFILNSFSRYYHDKLGYVYIGAMGDEKMKLKIAVIKCNKGSSVPGGSTVAVKNAVEVLRPKAVFCVGFCAGLNRQKVQLGDVVVSAKLITYAPTKVLEDGIQELGVRVPLKERILNLIKHVADGWEAPLKDPEKLKVTVHRDGVFLSGPELVDNEERRNELVKRFPDAIAIEMEGEGLYAAAHDLEIPWIIIKGVSDFADGDKTETNSWRPFASFMAASIVAHILLDCNVFRNWPHYGREYAEPPRATKRSCEPIASGASAAHAEPDHKRTKLTAEPTVEGTPSQDELETLSPRLATSWKKLGRRLGFQKAEMVGFHKNNEEYDKKAMRMLFRWKEKNGSGATYEVLHAALCHEFVQRRDLAEEFCLATR